MPTQSVPRRHAAPRDLSFSRDDALRRRETRWADWASFLAGRSDGTVGTRDSQRLLTLCCRYSVSARGIPRHEAFRRVPVGTRQDHILT